MKIFLEKEKAQARYNICKKCEHFLPTTQCDNCGCFMKIKVKIQKLKCPIGKW